MNDTVWTGELRKGEAHGIVRGEMRDKWGWVVSIYGELQEGGVYKLTGTLGDPPESLRISAIDGPPPS